MVQGDVEISTTRIKPLDRDYRYWGEERNCSQGTEKEQTAWNRLEILKHRSDPLESAREFEN